MNRSASATWGIILIAVGAIFLLWSMELIFIRPQNLVGLVFAMGGAGFLGLALASRANWWGVIPGMVLLALGGLVGLQGIVPIERWGGTLFLGAIGTAFWLVFLRSPENWWAIIPGGVLSTLALVAAPLGWSGPMGGAVFFLGMGGTFALVAVLPGPQRNRWALIPAGVLTLLGVVQLAAATAVWSYLWPTLLILGGLYLLRRQQRID